MWKPSDVIPAPSRRAVCGAARLGVLLGLDDHERTRFTEHEAVTILVERTRSTLGVSLLVVMHASWRTRDGQGLDDALDSAGHGDVHVTHDNLPPA